MRLNLLAGMTTPRFSDDQIRVIDVRNAYLQAKLEGKHPFTLKVLHTISQYVDDLQVIAIYGDIKRAEAELKQHLDCQPAAPLKRVIGVDYEVGKDFIRATYSK